MSFISTLGTSLNFLTITADGNSVRKEDPVIAIKASATTSLTTQVKSTKGSTSFFIPVDYQLPTSDGEEVMLATALAEASETPIPSSAEPGRLSFVDEVEDSGRLGVVIDLGGPGSAIPEGFTERGLEEATRADAGIPPLPTVNGTVAGIVTIASPTPISDEGFSFPESDTGRAESMASRTFQDGSEKIVGLAPEVAEKQRILATYATDIIDGYARTNVVFVKKFTSKRGLAEKYTILRKRVFHDATFTEVMIYDTDDIPILTKYVDIAKSFAYPIGSIFAFEDKDIEKDNIYIYKVKVKWNKLTDDEVAQRNVRLLSKSVTEMFHVSGVGFGTI